VPSHAPLQPDSFALLVMGKQGAGMYDKGDEHKGEEKQGICTHEDEEDNSKNILLINI
jgi:hypothetical protein